jgi:Zn-dependent peptidase ImmA (M78 family)
MIYNMKKRPEYEANVFASEVLLPDTDIIELANAGYDIEQISTEMDSDVNLVALKLATLSQNGHNYRQFESRANFLR